MKSSRRWTVCISALMCGVAAVIAACSSGSSDDSAANDADSGQDGSNADVAPPPDDSPTGSETGIVDAGPTAKETACENYVNAFCARWNACSYYSTCPVQAGRCPDLLFATGTSLSMADVPACVTALASASCVDLASNKGPDACQKVGTRGPGEACAEDRQCASMKCVDGDGFHCGYCAGLFADGGDCTNNISYVCPPGQYCDYPGFGGTLVCKTPVVGAGCNVLGPTYHSCPSGMQCLRGPSDPLNYGACKLYPQPGQQCAMFQGQTDPFCAGGAQCDIADAATGAGTCIGGAQIGQACGRQSDGFYIQCVGGTCNIPDGGVAGTCGPYATVGQKCGAVGSEYLQCDPTTACVASVTGQPTKCVPLYAKGQACGVTAEHYPDGGDSGVQDYISCQPGAVCTNDPCFFPAGAPANPLCVANPPLVGDDCATESCSVCASWLECYNGKCIATDRSSCN